MSESSADHVDEHVVFFTTALGDPAAERYPSLRAAVSRVESLCNDDDVQDARVFQLVPVPLNVRPYFRVELDGGRPAAAGRPPEEPQQREEPAPAPPRGGYRDDRAEVRPEPRDVRDDHRDEIDRDALVRAQAQHDDYGQDTYRDEHRPEAYREEPAGDRQDLRRAMRDLREERRPMREMRDEVAPPQPRLEEPEREPAPERGRSLGFFVH